VKILSLAASMVLVCSAAAFPAASNTLIIYDTLSKPFSLVNEVAPIEASLKRFDTRVQTLADSKVTDEDLQKADFIVLAGISGFPKLKPEVLKSLQQSSKPVMAVGAASCFASDTPSTIEKASAPLEKTKLNYRGAEWILRVDPFYGETRSGARVLAGTSTSKGTQPLAWKAGNRMGFATLPTDAPLSMVFSDVLLDFYGAAQEATPAMVFVIQDYNPSCNPAALRRLVDFFESQKMPFVVTAQMKEVPPGVEITPRDEFLDGLRYAQAHGGRVFLRGGNGPERLEVFHKEGIRVEGTEDTPSIASGLEVGSAFVQRIPGEAPVPYASAVPLRLPEGGWLLPPNVHAGMDGAVNAELLKMIRGISSLRGGLAVVVIPAWMRFQDMFAAVEAARSSSLPVIDPVTRFSVPRS
jgi:hypothetical protein